MKAEGVWYAILIGLAFVSSFLLLRIKKVMFIIENTKSLD
jgi:hypothetical protein